MSSKGLDLSKFKRISSDDKKTVMKHEDGHFLHVSHKNLNKGLIRNLGKLPLHKFAEGGLVEDTEPELEDADEALMQSPSLEAQAQAPWQQAAPMAQGAMDAMPQMSMAPQSEMAAQGGNGFDAMAETEQAQAMQNQMPEPEMAGTNPAISSPSVPGADVMSPDMMAGYDTAGAQSAYANAANAQGQLGERNAAIAGGAEQELAQMQQSHAKADADYDAEHNALVTDIMNGHIEPNHYLHSLSTAGKISTAIGLILGGLGAVGTQGKNLALDVINKNIDNDIHAQELESNKKHNLLSSMEKHYGDKVVARSAAKALMLDITAQKLAQSAAKAQGPLAKAQAQLAIAQLKQQQAQLAQQTKMRLAGVQGMQSGNYGMAIKTMVPPAQQAAAYKEMGSIQDRDKAKQLISDSLRTIGKEGFAIMGTQGKAQREAAKSTIMTALQKSWKGPMSDSDMKRIQGLLGSEYNTEAQVGKINEQFMKLLDANSPATPILSTLPGFQSKSPTFNKR